jgi:hypothetical protein
VLVALALAACKTKEAAAPQADASAAPLAKDEALRDPSVKPVYPQDTPPAPIAEKLCAALHEIPVNRRAACCEEKPGIVLTSECVRNLSGALANKAVSLDEGEVEACRAAIEHAFEGCDWVGPYNRPPPKACLGIVHGALELKSPCRSSLECKPGLRCLGSGPTDVGQCGPPFPIGRLCNSAVDTLAVYTRQDDYEEAHPACAAGWCDRTRCEELRAEGGACRANPECGPEARCKDGICTKGRVAAAGESCLGGDCGEGLRCVNGKCAKPKPLGAACESDAECNAACVEKKCAKSCTPFPQLRPGALQRLHAPAQPFKPR